MTELTRGSGHSPGPGASPVRSVSPALATVTLRRRGVLALAAALLVGSTLGAAEEKSAAGSLHLLTYSGEQQALEQLDREIRDAGRDAGKLAAIETRLLQALGRGDATFAARQAICQRLGLLLAQATPGVGNDAAKKLSAMLVDDRDSDLARLALEPVPGDAVDALFTAALAKTEGRTRLGIIGSLGRRHSASAVAPLAGLLNNNDSATAAAAAKALGQIGTSSAVTALRSAPAAISTAAAEAMLVAAPKLPAAERTALLRDLERDSSRPAPIRAAAFRVSLSAEPASAATRIIEALTGRDDNLKPAALEAVADVPGTAIVQPLAKNLPSWEARLQAAVVSALGRRGDPAAIPAVSAAASHADPEVRRAAFAALGQLPGNRDTTLILARAATGGNTDEAKTARQSLARLNGPDVNAAILSGAERGESAVRVAFLEQLALRNMTEALPLLRRCRGDADAAVRLAAVSALGEIAPASEVPALLEWSIGATDEAEQSRALRSAVNVALRDPNHAERGRTICEAIEKARPEVATRLLPALPRIGGEPSAACAARLALRADATLAKAAVDTLNRWPDQTALNALADVAGKSNTPALRNAALDAALAAFERDRGSWSEKSSAVVAALFASTQDPEKRRPLLALLNRAKDDAASKLVAQQQNDPAMADAARYTAQVIAANRVGPPKARASTNAATARNALDGKTSTRWTATANGEEWFEVDFRTSRPLRKITLDQSGRATDFPERYEVFVTNTAEHPGAAVASGKGQRNKTVIELPAGTAGRYLIIKNTQERPEGQWAISELMVD